MLALNLVEDALSCPICLDEFRKVPKILSACGHSFCASCIEHWYIYSLGHETGILRCPVCKSKTNLRTLRAGRSKKIATNLHMAGKFKGDDRPPPSPASLRKLLADSATVAEVLKVRGRLKKGSRNDCADICMGMDDLRSVTWTDLRNVLTCNACHFRLDEARMLPACHHSFCTSCLQKLYTPCDGENAATVVCPTCSALYRFDYLPNAHHSVSGKDATGQCKVDSGKAKRTEHKTICDTAKPPPSSKLASYLPFDYVLSCLLEAIPQKL